MLVAYIRATWRTSQPMFPEKTKNIHPEKNSLYFRKWEIPPKFYILGNGNPKKLIIFQKNVTFTPKLEKNKTIRLEKNS